MVSNYNQQGGSFNKLVLGMSVPPTSTDLSIFIRILVVYTDIRGLCSIIRKSVRVINYVIIV